jgi:hypothetical protein
MTRDQLWRLVNAEYGVALARPWNGIPIGTAGMLRRFGNKYALVEFHDEPWPLFVSLPIFALRATGPRGVAS